MKRILLLTAVFIMMLGTSFSFAQADADNFYKSDWVKVEKVSFSNQYKMKVAGNLFLPKTMKEGEKYPAIIVGHPMGAIKEQSANLYATKMAERGFVTLSIDLSFWGGSEGEPRKFRYQCGQDRPSSESDCNHQHVQYGYSQPQRTETCADFRTTETNHG